MWHFHDIPHSNNNLLPSVSVSHDDYKLKKNLFTACHGTFYRKKLFTSVNFFIHLNLSISLLLALAVFVSGIETATANHVSVQKMNVV